RLVAHQSGRDHRMPKLSFHHRGHLLKQKAAAAQRLESSCATPQAPGNHGTGSTGPPEEFPSWGTAELASPGRWCRPPSKRRRRATEGGSRVSGAGGSPSVRQLAFHALDVELDAAQEGV